MKEVLECTECSKFFTSEEALEKHAEREHGTNKIEKDEGLFSFEF